MNNEHKVELVFLTTISLFTIVAGALVIYSILYFIQNLRASENTDPEANVDHVSEIDIEDSSLKLQEFVNSYSKCTKSLKKCDDYLGKRIDYIQSNNQIDREGK